MRFRQWVGGPWPTELAVLWLSIAHFGRQTPQTVVRPLRDGRPGQCTVQTSPSAYAPTFKVSVSGGVCFPLASFNALTTEERRI